MPVLKPESLRQDLHQNGPSFPLPAEHGYPASGKRLSCCRRFRSPRRRLDALAVHAKEVSRRDHSQVGILRDLVRPPASAFGEISFGQGLQPPGNPPEQMFPVPGSRFFLKHLLILLAQIRQCGPAQASQSPSIPQCPQFCFPLRGRQPQSHERSLPPHKQVRSERSRLSEKRRQDGPRRREREAANRPI